MKPNCPACGEPFEFGDLSLDYVKGATIKDIIGGKLILDLSNITYEIYTCRCKSCGEFVYHSENALWGDWEYDRCHHRWLESKYRVQAKRPQTPVIGNTDEFTKLLNMIKKDPSLLNKLKGE